MEETILIVDDKIKLCKSLAQNFEQRGYRPLYATREDEALEIFSTRQVHAVLLDIMLGEQNGLDVLQDLLRIRKNVPVIMITGYASIDTAVQSIKLGAFDYIKKPLDFEKLLKIIENAIRISDLKEENQQLKDRLLELAPQVITQNQQMLDLCNKARKLADTALPILICGENGTGKEIIADFIHATSPRGARKMRKVNCAAFPETLLDNELFGHEKGAYTGADSTFKGVFERAHGSSLFLDEIGDMSLTIQAKILRTLQNHEIRRLGGDHTITVDVRFLAATNKDLQELIQEKSFRQDLFYRLNTAMLHLTPLRERKEDIPLLVEHFLSEFSSIKARNMKRVSSAVFDRFSSYHWPGNIRELKNVVHYAAAIASGSQIDIADLPPNFTTIQPKDSSGNIREELEKNLILKTLRELNYNKKQTAEFLNMSRKTLYNKLEKYGISIPR